MTGYGLTIIPASWAFGKWRKSHKTILALGPLRLTFHFGLGGWKEINTPNPRDRKR